MPDIEEVTDLARSLEEKLQVALGLAGGSTSDVVLVLDLDETAFTPLTPDSLATSVWFQDLCNRWTPQLQASDGLTREETLDQTLAVVDCFYPRVPVGPTDTSLAGVLRDCRSRGLPTLGLTARRPGLAAATWEQMGDRVQLDFDAQNPPPDAEALAQLDRAMRVRGSLPPDRTAETWEGLSCERGVWFTANANKGALLRHVLPPGRHVVFADDGLRHVRAVRDALDGYAASVFGLHFTAATAAAARRLDPASCDRALAGHLSALFSQGDPGFADLLRKGQPFLCRFIAEQAAAAGSELQALAAAAAAMQPRPSGAAL